MKLPGTIPSALRGSSFEAAIAGLRELYEELEESQSEALASIAARGPELACPEGCGSCCEGFVPDLLPVEARYLAAWLLAERPELAGVAAAWPPSGPEPRGAKPPCPFHEAGRRGGKCGVYPARPLICRLFAFSALRGRDGLPGFALCKRMPSRGGRRSWSGPELAAELGELLPDMAHYGALVAALVPEEAGRRALLVEALPAELRRLSLVISLSAYEEPDREDPDEPEPSTPAPAPAAA